MLTRMTRMARMLTHMLTRMTRWLAGSHIIHTRRKHLLFIVAIVVYFCVGSQPPCFQY